MKKITWIILLVVMTFAGDRLGGMLLTNTALKSNFRYSKLYGGNAESDILLIGNSRGLIFYQPYIESLTSKSTLNLSYNGLPIDVARVMVEDYMENYPKPQTVLIDVTMCDRINPGLISGFNFYTSKSERLNKLIKEVSPSSYNGGQVSKLFKCNGEIFQRALYYLLKSDEDWLTDREMNTHYIENVDQAEALDFNFEGDKSGLLGELTQVVDILKSEGVTVHLLINPYYPPFTEKFIGFENWKKEIESATGEQIHDYSTAITDLKSFGDYQHLNKYGSKLFLDLLKADGLLH